MGEFLGQIPTHPAYLWKKLPSSGVLLVYWGMPSGSSMLIEDPSLSEQIEGLIGLLLGRLHIETGRFHEGIVFGGGIIVDVDAVSEEEAFPSLIVRFRDGKLSQRSRLIAIPAKREERGDRQVSDRVYAKISRGQGGPVRVPFAKNGRRQQRRRQLRQI